MYSTDLRPYNFCISVIPALHKESPNLTIKAESVNPGYHCYLTKSVSRKK